MKLKQNSFKTFYFNCADSFKHDMPPPTCLCRQTNPRKLQGNSAMHLSNINLYSDPLQQGINGAVGD